MESFLQTFQVRLRDVVAGIDLQRLSRVPFSRLKDTAIPNIGLVELVTPEAFQDDYIKLYEAMFHGGERERSSLIVERLREDFAGRRSGLAPYKIIGIRDSNGEAIGAAQFSILFMPGLNLAVPYLQYIYIRKKNRRQHMSEVLHMMVLAVATADARILGEEMSVPFTLFESEPPNHGTSQSSRATATERIKIHARGGSRALMLSSTCESSVGVISAHVQPGLELDASPLTLIWVVRPSPAREAPEGLDIGKALLRAYYQSLRDEGFPEENILLAEKLVEKRSKGRKFILLPLEDVTSAMYRDLETENPALS
ncbi:hypothetical protein M433DRAFT_132565 [Acidomyces richmondensis BFW]|nr:MAG: hypothetical protein FE78DRAFT_67512 [Acidomyces sp. 'richmondensis']KYG47883.1 hypothetical protein M433DRAFT_132565 [Acidomyces richmondensis BFW]